MRGRDLIDITRTELDDVGLPPLWSNVEMLDYAIDAENEACRRGRLLVDSMTDKICHISLANNTANYKLDPRIIFIRRVKLSGVASPLSKIRVRDLDASYPGWENQSGAIRQWATGFSSGYITFNKKPDAAIYPTLPSIKLTVIRLPLQDVGMDSELEIPLRYQRNLRHWMKFRAYSKEDGDTFDPKKAALALELFEREFGVASPAYVEEFIDENYNYESDEGVY